MKENEDFGDKKNSRQSRRICRYIKAREENRKLVKGSHFFLFHSNFLLFSLFNRRRKGRAF